MSNMFIAHGDAYNAGRIHRDVSAGNVLICIKEEVVGDQLVQERVGLLTDWELSKRTTAPNTARQPNRTVCTSRASHLLMTVADFGLQGTWQFLSAFLLDNPFEACCISDESEAFFPRPPLLCHPVPPA